MQSEDGGPRLIAITHALRVALIMGAPNRANNVCKITSRPG